MPLLYRGIITSLSMNNTNISSRDSIVSGVRKVFMGML